MSNSTRNKILTIRMSKSETSEPWGFRLQGGIDVVAPLVVLKVDNDGLAEKAGLRVGDQLIQINGFDISQLLHKDAHDLVRRSGNYFQLVISRANNLDTPQFPQQMSGMKFSTNFTAKPFKSFHQSVLGNEQETIDKSYSNGSTLMTQMTDETSEEKKRARDLLIRKIAVMRSAQPTSPKANEVNVKPDNHADFKSPIKMDNSNIKVVEIAPSITQRQDLPVLEGNKYESPLGIDEQPTPSDLSVEQNPVSTDSFTPTNNDVEDSPPPLPFNPPPLENSEENPDESGDEDDDEPPPIPSNPPPQENSTYVEENPPPVPVNAPPPENPAHNEEEHPPILRSNPRSSLQRQKSLTIGPKPFDNIIPTFRVPYYVPVIEPPVPPLTPVLKRRAIGPDWNTESEQPHNPPPDSDVASSDLSIKQLDEIIEQATNADVMTVEIKSPIASPRTKLIDSGRNSVNSDSKDENSPSVLLYSQPVLPIDLESEKKSEQEFQEVPNVDPSNIELNINSPDNNEELSLMAGDASTTFRNSAWPGVAEITAEDVADLGPLDPELGLLTQEPKSWTKAVDKKIYEELSEKEVTRQEHIYEFIMSEKNHCIALIVIQNIFAKRMRREGFTSEAVEQIFPSGLKHLIEYHFKFLSQLRHRQRQNPIVDTIEDILRDQFSAPKGNELRLLYSDFCNRQQGSIAKYKQMADEDSKFATFAQLCAANPLCKKSIINCTLYVAQRLTRYPLLIEPLIKMSRCDRTDESIKLQQTHDLIKKILSAVNAKVTEKELKMRRIDLLDKIDAKSQTNYLGKKFRKLDLISNKRRLMFEGVAYLQQAKGKQQLVTVIVLSDVVIFMQESNQRLHFLQAQDNKTGVVSLEKLLVREKAGSLEAQSIYLISSSAEEPELYELQCQTPRDKNVWITKISAAVNNFCVKQKLDSSIDDQEDL